jgi:hypothetical protein
MEKCPLLLLKECKSPSKTNEGWACTKPHEERVKMCIEYVIACNKLEWRKILVEV